MGQFRRFHPELPPRHPLDGNIAPGHPAEAASWIWLPGRRPEETAVAEFTLDFDWVENAPLRLHLTADQRFQLRVDGEWLASGPDRGDLEHWSVSSLEISMTPGRHQLSVRVWYIAEDLSASRMDPEAAAGTSAAVNPPMAQISWRGGFLLAAADRGLADQLDTGRAAWRVADLTSAFTMRGPENLGYHDIGPAFGISLAAWHEAARDEVEPEVIRPPLEANIHGVKAPGWVLADSGLPEQVSDRFTGGTIRALRPIAEAAPWAEADARSEAFSAWQTLIEGRGVVEVAPRSTIEVLWDTGTYVCGYPDLLWSGGAGAQIEVEWAESLYNCEPSERLHAMSPKGKRDEWAGKRWLGFGDRFTASGADGEAAPVLWWRSGRYLRLRVRCDREGLRLERLALRRTGYPLAYGAEWRSSDRGWDQLMPQLALSLSSNAHEHWVDCPYYEQMQYVGDTRMHALSNFVAFEDGRISRRALQLMDWSRGSAGIAAERYPSAWRQESGTYAMIYPLMLRDRVLWCDDHEWVAQSLLPGLRQTMETIESWREPDGGLGAVPGWPCVDWVGTHGWSECCGPGMREGDSSIVNLHAVAAFQAHAEVEGAIGDPLLAQRANRIAAEIFVATIERYWDEGEACLRDTRAEAAPSQHAQVLAVLTGLLSAEQLEGCRLALLDATDRFAPCTISFAFYLLEALYRLGEAEAFHRKLDFWRALPGQGFVTTPECPEPARSDCHAWGAHPLFHSFASIAGIRPAATGFREVAIRPMPGDLTRIEGSQFHPRGHIRFRLEFHDGAASGEIELPPEVDGSFTWQKQRQPLKSGINPL